MIPVAEIFGPTIQGEGPNVGLKTLFVRVAGCDFKCEWCDSKFAWNINENTERLMPNELANKLIDKCHTTNTRHVILTGGNPCLYNFEQVITALHENNITVDIETQGSLFPNWIINIDTIVISPKAPSSKQKDVYENVENFVLNNQNKNIAIKIPVFDEKDLEFAMKYYKLIEYTSNTKLYVNVGNNDVKQQGDISQRILSDYRELIEKVLNTDMRRVYILPQVHTLVWGNRQGV